MELLSSGYSIATLCIQSSYRLGARIVSDGGIGVDGPSITVVVDQKDPVTVMERWTPLSRTLTVK